MNLLIFGPPGSGKGTQADLLVKKFNLQTIDTGSLLREIAKGESEVAKEIRTIQAQGKMTSDDIVSGVINDHLINLTVKNNILFDGYPRTINQWNLLKKVLVDNQMSVNAAIFLILDDEICKERIQDRLLSKKTGKIFNSKTVPPPQDWPAEDLFKRSDSSLEVINNRFSFYHKDIDPLVEAFKVEEILISVDASLQIELVHEEIVNKLKMKGLVK